MPARALTPSLPAELREGWSAALRLDAAVLEAMPCPLARTRAAATSFGLTPLPEPRFEPPRAVEAASEKPSFRALSEPVLLTLRRHVYAREEPAVVARWAETTLRFCEVRLSFLERRATEKCGDAARARLHVLHLAAFLLDHGAQAGDARFLNTVLKLLEARWLVRRAGLARDLAGPGPALPAALFQLRLRLASERALAELSRGGSP